MKVFIFWATNPITTEPDIIDSIDWKSLIKKPEPIDSDILDSSKGLIHGISIMGRTHKADHVALEENPPGHPSGSIKVTFWDDDPNDRRLDEMHAKQFIYEPVKLINTKWICQQFTEMWLSDKMKKDMEDSGQLPMFTQNHKVKVHSFIDFVKPPEELTLHGIWQTDKDNALMTEIDHPGYSNFV